MIRYCCIMPSIEVVLAMCQRRLLKKPMLAIWQDRRQVAKSPSPRRSLVCLTGSRPASPVCQEAFDRNASCHAPRANAISECFLRNERRECLIYLLIKERG